MYSNSLRTSWGKDAVSITLNLAMSKAVLQDAQNELKVKSDVLLQ